MIRRTCWLYSKLLPNIFAIITNGVLLSLLFGKVKVDEVTGILLSSKDYIFDPDVSMDIFFLMDFVQHSGNSSKLLE